MSIALEPTSSNQSLDFEESDDQLMGAYSRGHIKAFDKLYGRYKQPLFAYFARNCRQDGIASELYQDVWLRVISSASSYNGKGKFRSWLFTLAHNRLVDFYRSSDNQVIKEELGPEHVSSRSVEEQVEVDSLKDKLDQVVQSLPLEQKTVFYLREEAGFALREIAEIQGISLEAAKSRLRYAYKRLRDNLEGGKGGKGKEVKQ